MVDMAQHFGQGPVQLRTIAERQKIPVKYLEQIIIPLKKAGLIRSVRGPKGGHVLARPPEQITIGEVTRILEGGLRLTECIENPAVCDRSTSCLTRVLWKAATEAMRDKLDTITLADLLHMELECDPEPGGRDR
jgi:Rrf2 family protein